MEWIDLVRHELISYDMQQSGLSEKWTENHSSMSSQDEEEEKIVFHSYRRSFLNKSRFERWNCAERSMQRSSDIE
jgi:hypothetical protein